MKNLKWLNQFKEILSNKTIVITGTTSGLGKEVCAYLSQFDVSVFVGVRNTKKAADNFKQLKNVNENFKFKIFELDLKSFDSVIKFADTIKKECPNGIDALINNAGIYAQKPELLSCGYEKHFVVNFLSPIILTQKLLPLLEKQKDSRVVFLSSISIFNKKIDFNNIDFKNSKSDFNLYANTKLWLTYYATEWKRQLENSNSNVCINLCHPGVSASSLFVKSEGKWNKFVYGLANPIMKLLFPSPKTACLSEIYGIVYKTNLKEWLGPRGFTNVYGKPKAKKLKLENDEILKNSYNITNQILKDLKVL
ncbi:MAG: SDR family NAD(P)-dependent oxidoreductase [Clostridia bacterium]|nr:SDR family NAD(P)-dependent oxidoreductase [Clostridia bacterium]